jgi:hypothetical protein
MKKMICLVVVVLMIAAVAIAQKKTAITAKDLPALKGTYTGILSFGLMEGDTSPCTLEILNDTVPVKAKLTIDNVKDQLASRLGIQGGKKVGENDDGALTSQGTIMFTGAEAKNFFEVSSAGAKTIKVYYYFRGLRGDGTLKKK